ncbi:hypothetical protein [Brevundimonas sp.]|uniref:hypothetical protein n=1 Tax=Brevundimonas sp. TaxID=1871086 RepID=UPI0035B3E4A8
MRIALLSATALTLAACSPPVEDVSVSAPEAPQASAGTAPPATKTPEPADDGVRDIDYIGRWTAADGRTLVVTDQPRGGMTLEFAEAGGPSRALPGSVTAEGLRFMRDDVAESAIIVPDPSDASRRCLRVTETETYCG